MKDVKEIIKALREANVRLSLHNGELVTDEASGEAGEELRAAILQNKDKLVAYFRKNLQGRAAAASIRPVEAQESYPLSSSQRRLWILNQVNGGSIAYNMPRAYLFHGSIDTASLEKAFRELVARHESLRTVFRETTAGDPRQFILPVPDATSAMLEVKDLRNSNLQEQQVADLVQHELSTPFDLSSGPLIKPFLYRLEDEKWIFSFVLHHIISDGWSNSILMKELLTLYSAFSQGAASPLPPLPVQYKDYASWQQQQLQLGDMQQHKAWWLEQMEGELPVLQLPADKEPSGFKTHSGGLVTGSVNASVVAGIRQLAQEEKATLFMTLLTATDILLYRYSGQDDLIVGTPVAGRDHVELEGQIGLYLNTLALRSRFSGEDDFRSVLQQVRQVMLQAYSHQAYPLDELVEALPVKSTGGNVLFNVLIDFHEEVKPAETRQPEGLQVTAFEAGEHLVSKFDLTFMFTLTAAGLTLTIEYSRDLYLPETIERMHRHFCTLLRGIIDQPGTPVNSLPYIPAAELAQLQESGPSDPLYQPVLSRIEQQTAAAPDKTALQYGDIAVSYHTLEDKAVRLAHYLVTECGIKKGEPVGILLDRSEHMIIAILGILKAGAVYVPIDTAYPKPKQEQIIQDTEMRVLLTQTFYAFDLTDYDGRVFAMDVQLDILDAPSDPLAVDIAASDPAYIIFTSGSTGRSKGCCITHGNLSNYISWCSAYYFKSAAAGNFGLYTSLSFDLTITSIFCPLVRGNTLYIYPQDAALSDILTHSFSAGSGIDSIKLTPSHISYLQDMGLTSDTVSCAIVGGEEVLPRHVEILRNINPAIRIYNEYGPTETTVGCMVEELEPDAPVTIGKAISNTDIYILDKNLQRCAIGIEGEICVGGAGVSLGYITQQPSTAGKFIPDPFKPGARLYRTGDTGRRLPDGRIRYTGRNDDQVKIRGYRVEPGEIETALMECPGVTMAAVIARRAPDGVNELAAYVAGREDLTATTLRTHAAKLLSEYMVPQHFIILPELPLTAHGKINRKALPDMAPEETADNTTAPLNSTEERLIAIWSDVLFVDKARLHGKSDFSALGGHSLKITRLASLIYKEFEVKIELRTLFTTTVLEEQARLIAASQRMIFSEIKPVEPQAGGYELSASQRRLWILSKLNEENAAYNVPGACVFEGGLSLDALTQGFNTLIRRHEVLRTVFRGDELGMVRQVVLSPEELGFAIGCIDLRNDPSQEERLRELVQENYARPFNLSTGPLLRANLFQLSDNKWVFVYAMHHIISDDWSVGILNRELMVNYNAFLKGDTDPLPPLRIQYRDYAAWQQQQLTNDALNIHKNYWKLCFEGELPVLNLPGDYPRPPVKTYAGGIVRKWLSNSTATAFHELLQQQDATLFMGLLASVNALLYRYTGQEDIVVGTSIASRQHPDLEDQIGFYVNTLALRSRFEGTGNYENLLETVKQVTIGAFEHQLYPFDELVEQLKLQRDASRHPLFEVMVVLQRSDAGSSAFGAGMGDLFVSRYDTGKDVASKFDITFFFSESGDGNLHLSIVYNRAIFSENTAGRILQHFETLFDAIVSHPKTALPELDLLPLTEKEQLNLFRASTVEYPADKTIIDIFREQAAARPDDTALVFENKALSYRELDEQSDRIAAHLRTTYQADNRTRIGVMLDRSEKMIVAILSILKAGAAYVPVDPDYPKARKSFMLNDSGVTVLLTESHYIFDLDFYDGSIFAVDIQSDDTIPAVLSPETAPQPADTAYVIYTSGSTGRPKGVVIRHRSLVDYVFGLLDRTNISDCRSFGLMSTLAGDLGNTVIYSALALGGSLHVFSSSAVMDAEALAATPVDCMKIVPSHWKALQEEGRLVIPRRSLVFGGEQLTRDVIDYLISNDATCEVYNHYGPTETTIGKLLYHVPLQQFDGQVPLGKPFSNTRIYILDEHHHQVPIGIPGEICIAGDGLATGYLNNPELTAERFREIAADNQERIYKTGDLGRWLPEGNIAFLGRKDGQVKIRGYRIEPGEIENVLAGHEAVSSAAVSIKTDKDGNKIIVAYVSGREVPPAVELQSYLQQSLPAYMIPAYIVPLEQLPLTANGKIDRKALPDPEALGLGGEVVYVAPRNEREEALVTVFQEVLNKKPLGINDNFFLLGGDSIKAIQVIARLRKLGFTTGIQDILLYPVIEHLADYVKAATRSISQETVTGLVPLSPIQQYFLQQPTAVKAHFNQSALLHSKTPLDEAGLHAAFAKLVLHHDALRMVFREAEEGWVQENKGEEQGYTLEVLTPQHEDEYNAACDRLHASFDLAQGPLFKAALFRGNDGDRLLIVAHHLVVDGVSWRILFEDLSTLYQQHVAGEAFSLPLKTDAFRYWMEKQVAYAYSPVLKEEELYWDAINATPFKQLTPDWPGGSNLKKDAAAKSVFLDTVQTERLLTKCHKAYRTTINDILLTALSLAVYHSMGADKVVARLEGHGREPIEEDLDISRTIGWFTTHYPVVLDVRDGNNIIRQLLEVKEFLHRIPGKGIGFGILKYLTGKHYSIAPEIAFNYLGDFGGGVSAGEGTPLFSFLGDYKGKETPDNTAREVLLNVNCMVAAGSMRLVIEYSAQQFKAETIDGLLTAFRNYLQELIDHLSREEKVHVSPVDLTYKGLNLEQLEELDKL
ncbi:amino acid adenylation domain-containing protein [Chitinophaga sp. Mgbs1]|uniref:Amino acid adenylation domain-containing protein n=1 Tax=Chitinophaga solisilvae TaxID=1233460 RepID=A0A433WPW2_9BACT|nr:amino acid adenylation domain-containing protein [Chitinophaga solisilvae]